MLLSSPLPETRLSSVVCGPSGIRLVYEGLRLPFDSVTWMCSFVFLILRAADGVTFTRTLGLEWTFDPFPPSKYSIKSDVCDLSDDRVIVLSLSRVRESLRFFVGIVTGLPSSGIE